MSTTPNDDRTATPENEPNDTERDPTPSETLALIWKWLRDYGPDWLRHYWDKERPKSKWHEILMVVLTVLIAGAAIYSAWIFQGQLSLMRDADRPWISVDIAINSPLTFDGNNVRIGFDISPKNIGRSPAQNIWINPTLKPAFMGDDLGEMQKHMCENARPPHEGLLSYLLFPGERYTQPIGLDVSVAEINSHWGKMPPSMGPPDPLPLVLVGCIDYTYEASPRHHQTGFAFDVVMNDGGLALKSKTPLSPKLLILRQHPFGGHFAN